LLKSPLILLYHRVANDPINSQLLSVSPENFKAHLKEMAYNYRVISLRELLEEVSRAIFRPKTLAITFDDGYLDNLTHAVPLLNQHGLPATIFITSGMIGSHREFWWDAMERVFFDTPCLPEVFEIFLSGDLFRFELTIPEARLTAHDRLCEALRTKPVAEIESVIDRLLKWANLPEAGRSSHGILDTDQVKGLSMMPGIEIGSHAVSHTMLSMLPPDQQKREIRISKRNLEKLLHGPIRFFSYPYGDKVDFTQETARLVSEIGYEAGFANIQGEVLSPVNRFSIPRRLVRNWSEPVFAAWLNEENKTRLEIETLSSRPRLIADYLTSAPMPA